jgi:hypothetical protein
MNLRERLTDWKGLLQRQTAEARQILRRLLLGRLVFTPREDEDGCYYEFAGQGSISTLLAGVVLPKVWWPQRDSTARRVRSRFTSRASGSPRSAPCSAPSRAPFRTP